MRSILIAAVFTAVLQGRFRAAYSRLGISSIEANDADNQIGAFVWLNDTATNTETGPMCNRLGCRRLLYMGPVFKSAAANAWRARGQVLI